MAATRLARRMGLDGNPLRRRTDKIAACFAALLLAMFLIGAPVMSIAAIGWAGRTGAAGQQAARSWHQVSAVLRQATPSPTVTTEVPAIPWSWPGGLHRTAGCGPAGSRSAAAWPLATRSGCGWTRRAADRSSAELPSDTGLRGHRGGYCHCHAGDHAVVPGVGRAAGT